MRIAVAPPAARIFCRLILPIFVLGLAPTPPARAAQPPIGAVHDSFLVQKARTATVTSRGKKVFYTKRWDLSGLPHYVPEHKVSGTIRLWGSNYITDGNLGKYWAEGFGKYQPGVKLDFELKSAAAALPGLMAGVADVGVDRKITWKELLAFQRIFGYNPLEITVATGSFNVPGWSNALVFVVNKANPISHLTLQQLDGIFGAERSGGWVGTEWHPEFARGPEQNIRTWGQLGLKGKWADKPIHVYGLNLQYQQATDISQWVLKGSDKWNEHLRMYANYAYANGTLAIGAKLLFADIGKDPYGIGYGSYSYLTPGTKILALARGNGSHFVMPSLDTVRDRSYPLHDQIYFYLNRKPGKPLDPKEREFVRYVLSREGQEAVQRDGKYLPLTARVVRAQLAKLRPAQ
jgi:phosphate transport system substrate-binding protein